MMIGTWHGDDLARAVAGARSAAGRRLTYLVAAAAGGGWALAAPGGRAGGTAVAMVALGGAAVESALVAIRGDAADRAADRLIDQGYLVCGRDDVVAGSVRRRVERLTTPHWRRRLAASLRWHLQQERLVASGGLGRMRPVPPIRGLLAHDQLVDEIAAMIERQDADPRACMLLTRILTSPPGVSAHRDDPHGARHLATSLSRIHSMLAAGHDDDGADGYSHAWCCGDGAPTVGQ